MKEILKKKLVDLAFLALAALLGIGVFYGYVMVKGHMAFDAALLEAIRGSQTPATEPAN